MAHPGWRPCPTGTLASAPGWVHCDTNLRDVTDAPDGTTLVAPASLSVATFNRRDLRESRNVISHSAGSTRMEWVADRGCVRSEGSNCEV